MLVDGFVELFVAALPIDFAWPEADSLEQRPFDLHRFLDCATVQVTSYYFY